MGRLQREINQKKRCGSAGAEAFLNRQRTADLLMRSLEQTLKPAGLSHTKHNVLHILRGAGSSRLACREIGQRMLTHDPAVLMDRLEARGLVMRSREKGDRRVITTRITTEGMSVLQQPVAICAILFVMRGECGYSALTAAGRKSLLCLKQKPANAS